MKKVLGVLGLMSIAAAANAIPIQFTASYSITARSVDPGLVIDTQDVAPNPFTFFLDVDGDPTESFNLFKIWTDECCVNGGEDTVHYPLTLAFNFSTPTGALNTTAETYGDFWFLGDVGKLRWDQNSWDYAFGGGGLLRISLEDENFNGGLFDLGSHGSKVKAHFRLVSAPTSVPEPGVLMLVGSGLLLVGLRRRAKSAA